MVLHGKETGRLVRLPHGEFVEVHEPLTDAQAWTLTQHEQLPPLELEATDSHGVRRPGGLRNKFRARASRANAEAIAKPKPDDLKGIEHH